jgi:hypothetical protein
MNALIILIVAVAVVFTLRRFFPGRASAPAATVRRGSANTQAGVGEQSPANDFVEEANAEARATRQRTAAALGGPLK